MSCITEILKLKGDKEVFIPVTKGEPWIAVEGGGTYKGHEYLIVLNKIGHRCGYVAMLPEHPFNNFSRFDDIDIECHGGVTFLDSDHGLKKLLPIPCTDKWIGFDCGDDLDLSDEEAFKKYFGQEIHDSRKSFFKDCGIEMFVRTFDYVEQECYSIIDQLIEKAA